MRVLPDRDELAVYTEILNLPLEICPPNHYELLDISPDEFDDKKIVNAAGKQIARLRGKVSPDLLRAARIILKRIQRAQTCLQEPRSRAAYDISLNGEKSSPSNASIWDELDIATTETSSEIVVPAVALAPSNVGESKPIPRRQSLQSAGRLQASKRKRGTIYFLAGLAITVGVLVTCIAVWSRLETSDAATNQSYLSSIAKAEGRPHLKANPAATSSQPRVQHENKVLAGDRNASTVNGASQSGATGVLLNGKSSENDSVGTTPATATSAGASGKSLRIGNLTALPAAIELPPQRTLDTEIVSGSKPAKEALEIGSVSMPGVSITIDEPYVMSSSVGFETVNDATQTDATVWQVRMRSRAQATQDKEKSSLDEIAAGIDEVVANVSVDSGSLKFAWAGSKHPQLAEDLRNCVLCVEAGDQKHRVQLRSCQVIRPVVLNFEQGVITLNVEGEHLPAQESLFLAVRPAQALMKSVSVEPSNGRVEVNKVVTLKASGDDQQQVEIRVILKKTPGKLMVAIGPRYRIGANWQPFTTERVNAGLKGLQDALERQQGALSEARTNLPSISSALSSAQSRLSSTNDAMQRHLLQVQVHGLQTRANRAQQLIERKERDIPETQGEIAATKKLVEIGNRLRNYTELGIQVGVKTTNGEFDLLHTE